MKTKILQDYNKKSILCTCIWPDAIKLNGLDCVYVTKLHGKCTCDHIT